MTFEQLKEKANTLPLEPGVYIMRDQNGDVIYVGKAKKLKNRVCQYFQESQNHPPKTKLMVSKIRQFDVIVAASEFEALVLECSLIKRHMPKYNILLKDDKGYPYIRLDMRAKYPKLELVSRISNDGGEYFGPFGSRGVTNGIIKSVQSVLKLPGCSKKFPRDVGKDRPCLNYHMDQCEGWCQEGKTQVEYYERMEQARQLLSGNYKKLSQQLKQEMLQAAEELDFELAANLRDKLAAIEALGQKQLVTAGSLADTDVVGFAQTDAKACFAVLHFSGGNLLDKDYEILSRQDDPQTAVSSLVKQYYSACGIAPKRVLLPYEFDDADLVSQFLKEKHGRSTKFLVPARGDNARLVELAQKNAYEEAQRVTSKEERISGTLSLLSGMLTIPDLSRIESYDISNISGSDIVASMVVFQDGRPKKSDYKKFKIEGLEGQDDYGSMRQVVTRRFLRYKAGDKGFDILPNLLLIDGGDRHASVALQALRDLDIFVPVVGMVKDDKHRTRALITPEGDVVHIDGQQSVFSFIGNIQEETHRFAISFHRQLRSKRLKRSELDDIPKIGPKRKEDLLRCFHSVSAIRLATLSELERLLPYDAAMSVYKHFHSETEEDVI